MKIVFMGTPDFAKGVLECICNLSEHTVTAVVTQPDKPKGRSQSLVASPVKEYALSKEIEVFQPVRIRNAEAIEELRKYDADIFIVAAFGQILPKEILEMPRYGCINVHASLLPKYRGAAPIQWAIANDDKITGVTIMQMNEGLDTGDILTSCEVQIDADETGESLFNKLMREGSKLLVDTLGKIEKGEITPVPQNDELSSYAGMIKKEMGLIDFSKSARSIECLVRAFTPWPGGFTYLNDKILKIKSCRAVGEAEIDDESRECAKKSIVGETVKITKECIYVKCGEGFLGIDALQPEGKKSMSTHDFLLGYNMKTGIKLG